MGVPAFFRWLSRKYPAIVVHCVEEKAKSINGVTIPVDSSKPNPNDFEFDNLYLDMNGIIHPCCHPENKPAPKNEDEMMVAIFEYIDRLFAIVRPRKLLYMAIDGVAPRAKMNQQRSRRFRASKESSEKAEEIKMTRERLLSEGAKLPPEKTKEEHFDSNCITPGTPFMDRLAKCLNYYIHQRLNTDPGWRDIEVILSDANVPGEGEHKIMNYIRKQRANPSHDPNTAHCLCGADADLIMLGLATHEPNFTIIREEFKPNQPRPCELCGELGHDLKECTGLSNGNVEEEVVPPPVAADTEFIFLRLNVLREYLAEELTLVNLPFPFDLERAIDDWVFMCFFVGNDFLPHLPSLEIREGAIDRLVEIYKRTVFEIGEVCADLGAVEDEIFKKRQENELAFKRREKDKKKRMRLMNDRPAWIPSGQYNPQVCCGAALHPYLSSEMVTSPQSKMASSSSNVSLEPDTTSVFYCNLRDVQPVSRNPSAIHNARHEAMNMRREGMARAIHSSSYDRPYNSPMGAYSRFSPDVSSNPSCLCRGGGGGGGRGRGRGRGWEHQSSPWEHRGEKRKSDSMEQPEENEEEEGPKDEVRLWEAGWKDRYYQIKFEVDPKNIPFRHKVANAYCEGLCWVLRYYYQGCASWNWYFPYHYAPFASDFVQVRDLKIQFDLGAPDSTIIDFYPTDFKIDLNGKKYAWQGVALLPFVDEERLHVALKEVYPLLTADERRRNVRGDDRLYVRQGHTSFDFFIGLYENGGKTEVRGAVSPRVCGESHMCPVQSFDIDPSLTHGLAGTVLLAEDAVLPK
ncbi:XRN2, partial [Cordylochernes scorpioides]